MGKGENEEDTRVLTSEEQTWLRTVKLVALKKKLAGGPHDTVLRDRAIMDRELDNLGAEDFIRLCHSVRDFPDTIHALMDCMHRGPTDQELLAVWHEAHMLRVHKK